MVDEKIRCFRDISVQHLHKGVEQGVEWLLKVGKWCITIRSSEVGGASVCGSLALTRWLAVVLFLV